MLHMCHTISTPDIMWCITEISNSTQVCKKGALRCDLLLRRRLISKRSEDSGLLDQRLSGLERSVHDLKRESAIIAGFCHSMHQSMRAAEWRLDKVCSTQLPQCLLSMPLSCLDTGLPYFFVYEDSCHVIHR